MPFYRPYARGLRLVEFAPVDLVLCNTHLSGGTVFALLAVLAGLPVTAFLYLPVETTCFWLPALDGGRERLGLPALRPSEFASALEEMARCFGAVARVNKQVPDTGAA